MCRYALFSLARSHIRVDRRHLLKKGANNWKDNCACVKYGRKKKSEHMWPIAQADTQLNSPTLNPSLIVIYYYI